MPWLILAFNFHYVSQSLLNNVYQYIYIYRVRHYFSNFEDVTTTQFRKVGYQSPMMQSHIPKQKVV